MSSKESKLRISRLMSGLNQKSLAKKCGLSQSEISRYECGNRRPRLKKKLMISKILGINDHILFPEDEPKKKSNDPV